MVGSYDFSSSFRVVGIRDVHCSSMCLLELLFGHVRGSHDFSCCQHSWLTCACHPSSPSSKILKRSIDIFAGVDSACSLLACASAAAAAAAAALAAAFARSSSKRARSLSEVTSLSCRCSWVLASCPSSRASSSFSTCCSSIAFCTSSRSICSLPCKPGNTQPSCAISNL